MTDSMPLTPCALCGGPLDEYDIDHHLGACHACRSPKGKIADLDIAIRASGDDPKRIRDWPVVRHLMRKRFGDDRSDLDLWERCTDWLRAERGLTPNDYLPLSLDYLKQLLEQCFTRNADSEHATPSATGEEVYQVEPREIKVKRSTGKGEGQEKLVAALTMHHKYAADGCLNCEPVNCNALARLADVSGSTASAFFKKKI